ncbi:MAG: hypothetical protein QXG91_00525 [Candidatus Aenigmatarchaeota archaeon]
MEKVENPTEILKEEYGVIVEGLKILESFSKLSPNKVLHSDVKKLLEFFSQSADKCHHVKDEKSLFPLAEVEGIPKEGGQIVVMLLIEKIIYVRSRV